QVTLSISPPHRAIAVPRSVASARALLPGRCPLRCSRFRIDNGCSSRPRNRGGSLLGNSSCTHLGLRNSRHTVVRVLVGIGIAVVEVPAIFTVRDTSAIAFSIAVVHRPPQQVRTVLVDLVVRPTAVIAINRWRVEVRVGVVVISGLPDANLLLPQVFQIFSLE